MSKLWQSTAGSKSDIAKKVEAFTVGNDYLLDRELVPFDIRASKVHAKALQKAGILTKDELVKLTAALSEILEMWN